MARKFGGWWVILLFDERTLFLNLMVQFRILFCAFPIITKTILSYHSRVTTILVPFNFAAPRHDDVLDVFFLCFEQVRLPKQYVWPGRNMMITVVEDAE